MADSWFIDWLSMYQVHDHDLSLRGSFHRVKYDLETGDVAGDWVQPLKHEGSYSSYLQISCDGRTVRVEGNPSRWGRLDNLFGLSTFSDCVRVYNDVLLSLGLPPFSVNTRVTHFSGRADSRARILGDGAVITRVDWTRNHAVGQGNEEHFIRALSTQSLPNGKTPFLYGNNATVDWGKGSDWRYTKVYSKLVDLDKKSRSKEFSHWSESDKTHFHRIARYCKQKGCVREEHTFKGKMLKKKNLHLYGITTESDFLPYLKEVETIMNNLSVGASDYNAISDQLLERGLVTNRQSANSTEAYAMRWMHGSTLERNSQYYVHRKRLLGLGIDISVPLDISKKLPTIKNERVITLTDLAVPKWYQQPDQPKLKLVG